MKILLVEDQRQKAERVRSVLCTAVSPDVVHVDEAKSFLGAVKKLGTDTYDLLVLDLVLPIRDHESPDAKGGEQLLSEILNGDDCHRPSHIICLTAYEETANLLKDDLERNLVHVVLYKEDDFKWKESLTRKAQYVNSRLKDALSRPIDFNIDVAIVTSSPMVELKEVLRIPTPFIGEYHQTDALHYYSTSWTTTSNREISVVACAAPSMGMTSACVTACKVIERWRPRFLVMTGIAAGTKNEQGYGDVLVAEAAYDYGSGKISSRDDGIRTFVPAPNQLHIDAELHAVLQRFERDQTVMDSIRREWYTEQPRTPRMVLGIIASGAAVVQDQSLVDEILNNSRKVVGLEMEAYGIFQAARLATAPKPRILVAKSIADFADKNKDDNWQQYSAFTSARFVHQFFMTATELQLGKLQASKTSHS